MDWSTFSLFSFNVFFYYFLFRNSTPQFSVPTETLQTMCHLPSAFPSVPSWILAPSWTSATHLFLQLRASTSQPPVPPLFLKERILSPWKRPPSSMIWGGVEWPLCPTYTLSQLLQKLTLTWLEVGNMFMDIFLSSYATWYI